MEITYDQIKQVILKALNDGAEVDYKLKTALRQYLNVQRRANMSEEIVDRCFNSAISDLKYERKIALIIGRQTKYVLTNAK